jgi:hypothetical protein
VRIASTNSKIFGLIFAFVLLAPWTAMQFTDEVNWTPSDFLRAGSLVLGVGIAFELALRRRASRTYRAAAALALAAGFLLFWINGAVGVIGSEDNPANLLYAGVLAVAALGSLAALFRPAGMALAMVATALTHASVAAYAVVAGLDEPIRVVLLNGVFIALWSASAWLFHRAELATRAR